MTWRVLFDAEPAQSLRKADLGFARHVLAGLRELASLKDPASHCKALPGALAGLWAFDVDDRCLLLDIRRGDLVVIALVSEERRGNLDQQ